MVECSEIPVNVRGDRKIEKGILVSRDSSWNEEVPARIMYTVVSSKWSLSWINQIQSSHQIKYNFNNTRNRFHFVFN